MKNSKLKRISTLILALVLVTSIFSACSVKNSNDPDSTNTSNGPKGFVYVPEYISLPSEVTDMQNVRYFDGLIYFTANVVVGQSSTPSGGAGGYGGDYNVYGGFGRATAASKEIISEPLPTNENGEYMYDVYATRIFKMNIDGTGLEQLPAYATQEIPAENQGSNDIIALCIDGLGNLMVAEQGSFYHYDENGNYVDDGRTLNIRKLDATGAEVSKLDMTSLNEEDPYFYISGLSADKEGNIYFSDGNQTIYIYDSLGTKKFDIKVDNWISSLVNMGDGTVAAITYENNGSVLKPIDPVTGTWKEGIPMPMNAWSAYPGNGDYLVFFSDGNNLLGFKEGASESEKILNWINCDIDGNSINTVAILPDGRVACLTNNFSYTDSTSSMEIAMLTKTDASTIPQKTYLSMATFYMDYTLKGKVIDFNKKNLKYRIEVTDYSQYNTQEDYSAGLMKLSTEIISGNIPDIICTSQELPLNRYITKGLLEDLYPYIDNDPELGREALVQDVFKTLENDGKLYQLCPSFNIYTVVGDGNRIGNEPGWTLDDMNKVLSEAPEGTMAFAPYFTRDNMLQTSMTMSMSDYVDWNTGECKFDSQGFVKLMEFAKTFPVEYNWEDGNYIDENQLIQSGQLLLHIMYMYDFSEFQMQNALFGGNLVFKGYPCESKNGNALILNSGLAMSSKCKDKEGAWEFMRILLSEDYQSENIYWGFPTNKAVFDEKIKDAMTPTTYVDENGNTIEQPKNELYVNDTPVQVFAMTQAELDMFMELIKNTNRTMTYDSNIMKIVTEEAGSFFSDQKAAADCASIIQSRVGIYVSEQR